MGAQMAATATHGIDPAIVQQAEYLFPGAAQAALRSNYIANRMAASQEQANKLDIAKNTRLYGSQATAQGHVGAAQATEQGRVQASQNYSGARVQAAQIAAAAKTAASNPANAATSGKYRALSAYITNTPGVSMDQIQNMSKQLGIDPRTLAGNSSPAQPAQSGGSQPEIRYDSKGNAFIKGPDGRPIPYS